MDGYSIVYQSRTQSGIAQGTATRNEPPIFSVVITTYRRPDFLAHAVESVLDQDFTDYELWVVDDDPTDTRGDAGGGDAGAVEAVVGQYPGYPITLVRHAQNRGISAARNTGLQIARGRYIVFLDDDDRFAPTFLSRAYRALRNAPASVGFAFMGRKIFQWDGEQYVAAKEYSFGYTEEVVLPGKAYLEHSIGGGSGLILSAQCAREIQHFNPNLAAEEDVEFLLRAALQFDYLVIPDYLHFVYNHAQTQATKNIRKVIEGKEFVTQTYSEYFSNRILANHYRQTARLYAVLGERSASRRAIMQAIRLAPLAYKNWVFFVLLELKDFLPTRFRQWFLAGSRQRRGVAFRAKVKK